MMGRVVWGRADGMEIQAGIDSISRVLVQILVDTEWG